MTDRKLMQQALNALEWNLPVIEDYGDKEQLQIQHKAITALHDRLAQPEQEPVAWSEREIQLIDGMIEVQLKHARTCDSMANQTMADKQKGWDLERVTLLEKIKGSTPPQRPWVWLTEPELHEINPTWPAPGQHWDYKTVLDFARAIERKLKEKNT
jgi:hypothetical protein